MKKEFETQVLNHTFGDLVPRSTIESKRRSSNKKYFYFIDGLWKYRIKTKNGIVTSLKSRFCADGRLQDCDDDETFSPTARISTIRTIISLCAIFGAELRSGDIPGAYLNADIDDDTEVYITQPKGFEVEGKEDWVYELKKALYGLRQAGKLWNSLLHSFLIEIGFKQNPADPCLYHKRESKNKEGEPTNEAAGFIVVAVTVDDFLYFGTENGIVEQFVEQLKERFDYVDDGEATWFLGMAVKQSYESIEIDQKDYVDTITIKYPEANKANTPGKPGSVLYAPIKPKKNSKFPYRELCGQLRYVTLTRPEIEYPLNQCCKYQAGYGDEHIAALLRIVGYLKKFPDRPLVFKKDYETNPVLSLLGVCDSSFADQPERTSSYGYLVWLNNKIVAWKGRTTPKVATSSAAAEYVAIAELLKELLHVQYVLEGLDLIVEMPLVILSDSNGAIGIAKFKKIHDRSKHIDVRYHFTRERIQDGTLRLTRVSTEENEADIFTKNLSATTMNRFLSSLLCG